MANQLISSSGQALVEIVFSVSIVAVVLSGLVIAVVFSQKATRSAHLRAEATQLAQQRIEFLRSERGRGDFWEDPTGYNETGVNIGNFTRDTTVLIIGDSPRRAEVEITISWADGNQTRDITLNTYITEY